MPSRQQSQRTTRRTPSASTGFHPVSSHRGHGMHRAFYPLASICAADFSALRRLAGVGVLTRRRGADEIGGTRLDERRRQALLPVADAARQLALHVLHELVDLALHPLDLAARVQNDLD